MLPQTPSCPLCGNRKHLRTAQGWRRCECAAHALVRTHIRRGETSYPKVFDEQPPFPLTDLTFVGNYDEYRHRVWRSVLSYPELHYEFIDAYRIVEVHFERDPDYSSARDLTGFGLLSIALGIAELPNKFLGPLVVQVLTMRQHHGVPTWVYSPTPIEKVRDIYTNELATMLAPGLMTGTVKPIERKLGNIV